MENFASGLSLFASIFSIIAAALSIKALNIAKGIVKVKGNSNQISMRVDSPSGVKHDKQDK